MERAPRARGTIGFVLALSAATLVGCSSDASERSSTAAEGVNAFATCPAPALAVVVTVDPWADIVQQLAGDCGRLTTIVEGSVGDPHDYELTPAATASFGEADLVVMNGLGYDHWAEDAVDALSSRPLVVDGGAVAGAAEGDNPHLWYDPDAVSRMTAAVTDALKELAPQATPYFDAQAADWSTGAQPYFDTVATMRVAHQGATYAATESVFDYMAAAVGLVDVTPEGYRVAVAHESEPGPRDVNDILEAISNRSARVLVYNTQTRGPGPEQVRDAADDAGVSVVDVTETMPAEQPSFVAWQLEQLHALDSALSG
jgi:zinc/manganese transport system substrate-binding protein